MTMVHGKNSRLLLADSLYSGFLRQFETGTEIEMADATPFGPEGHKYVPGLEQGTLSMEGMLDNSPAVGGQNDRLNSTLGAQNGSIITSAPAGLGVGEIVTVIEARSTNYALSSPIGDIVSFQASWQSEGQVDQGVSLHGETAETATANGTAVDNLILSAGGAATALHVIANTRSTSSTIKVQHSVDNSVWVDLATFAVVGAGLTATERIITAVGTVNRYLRAQWTLTAGTGSITFVVAAARR